ncbi:DNA helicase-2 / ATP-dependent DNA helicase PcrA [Rhizobiales bacterium GAS113]|nr:DNA helicase-2 / ATP-dependent DNA helicase PcrA [Rhizobiales bacterium GAS113]SED62561.1 DNA helicase-2 / ATP-dependent DNA helicase PcrA [Rhizobiales bacterium GAS188]
MHEQPKRIESQEPLSQSPLNQSPANQAAAPRAGGLAARALEASGRRLGYLEGLNAEQREAVETLDGPVLVLSGAGTGKTRVLTTRIAHIIAAGRAYPSQILAVTFTNKAAREMKHRVGLLLGEVAEGMPWLGTFHAIATKMLRRHAELVGLRSDFTILDTDDQIRLMKQVIAAANIDEKRWPARQFAHLVDSWKNRGLTPEKVPAGEGMAFGSGKGVELYSAYQARLATLNAADFGDLLLHVIRIFREHQDVLAIYHERFRFILVDEYQDTNVAQYLWLRLLAQGRKNVCCVGDDDQSIYGWRGAEVDNILRFEHDFPGAKVIRLEQNYRSTGHILAAASGLIAHNEGRLGKTLRTDAELGATVTVTGAWDSQEEARLIGDEIEALQTKGHSLSEMAVLVRISAQMREIEDRFVNLGLPYRVIGGPRFYERMEIRDALAYFRIVAQPADDLAFERILNTPKRGLAEATLSVLHNHARAARLPLLQAAEVLAQSEELKPKPRLALRDFVIAVARWAARLESGAPHTEVAAQILEESGYTDMWKADRSADAAGRLDNLKELVRSMEEFPDMRAFLEHVSLVMEATEGENEDRVSIMTLHGAKGLEFDTVFLPGWEDGLFPNQRALDENGRAGLEEERRLAYVGITRARRHAKLLFATNRRLHGLWQSTVPSRFIDELPEGHVEVANAPAGYHSGGFNSGGYGPSRFDRMPVFAESPYATPGWKRAQAQQRMEAEHGARAGSGMRGPGFRQSGGRLIEGEVVASSIAAGAGFTTGERVFHQKFGPGIVALVDGNKLTVDFDKAGRKMVLDSFMRRAG